MLLDVADSRIVAATSATLTWTGVDSDGEPADPGAVTVGVTRSDGSEVIAPLTATTVDGNARTVTLTPAQTAQVDRLTAVWTVSGTVVGRTQHDVVGGVYATTAQIRNAGDALRNEAQHPTSELLQARTEVEYQFERACKRAFVPRFATEVVGRSHGGDTLVLRCPSLREVVWADYWNGSAWTSVDADVSTIQPNDAGLAVLDDDCWPCGRVRIGYRHGYDRCPPDLRKAAIEAISYRIHSDNSSIDPRATSFTVAEAGVINLATPGIGMWVTAIPTVDAVLKDHRWTVPGIA